MRGALAAVVAVGCTTPVAAPMAKPATGPSCLADALGTVTAGVTARPECAEVEAPACVALCDRGDKDACFQRAIDLEAGSADDQITQAMFERSCRLGSAIGCTNRAAHLWATAKHVEEVECAARVFAKTCAIKDGFGCAMTGRLLVEAHHVDDGRRVLESSCNELAGPPCRFLAWFMEKGAFGTPDRAAISDLMKRACDGGDTDACGEHATVDEVFHP